MSTASRLASVVAEACRLSSANDRRVLVVIEGPYDRITSAIRLSGRSYLSAVLVPPSIQVSVATEELRSQLLHRGVQAHPIPLSGHANILESIEAATPSPPSRTFIIHGLETLRRTDREAYLRASSFARERLREASNAIILVLATETWSWLGLDLPDLARWVDGPFLMTGKPWS